MKQDFIRPGWPLKWMHGKLPHAHTRSCLNGEISFFAGRTTEVGFGGKITVTMVHCSLPDPPAVFGVSHGGPEAPARGSFLQAGGNRRQESPTPGFAGCS